MEKSGKMKNSAAPELQMESKAAAPSLPQSGKMEESGKMKNSAAPELQVESKVAAPVLGAGNYTEDRGTLVACRKRPRTGKYSALIIPRDIIFKILLLVPARVLIEIVRFVCKEWNAIITDPSFISAHFLHLSSSPGNVGLIFQDQDRHDAKLKRAFYFHPDIKVTLYRCRPADIELPIPAAILGSCNGLVLLHSATNRRELLLVNLITKAKISLPPLAGVFILDRPFTALGFAPSSGQYKVVYVSVASKTNRAPFAKAETIYNRLLRSQAKVSVCTVGVDKTWRTIDCKSVTQCYGGRGALLGGPPLSNAGSIYWFDNICFDYGLVLDVDAETLHPFTGPIDNILDHKEAYIIKMDTGGVGMVYDDTTDKGEYIWKVVELIVTKSKSSIWGGAVVVYTDDMYDGLEKRFPSCTIGPFRPLLFSFEKQELWLSGPVSNQYALVCYNWKTGSCWYAVVSDRPWPSHVAIPHLHVNSLLSLNKQSSAVN